MRAGRASLKRCAAPIAPESPAYGWTRTGDPRIREKAATTDAFMATPPWKITLFPTGRLATTLSR